MQRLEDAIRAYAAANKIYIISIDDADGMVSEDFQVHSCSYDGQDNLLFCVAWGGEQRHISAAGEFQ